jgi:hypothetical protein
MEKLNKQCYVNPNKNEKYKYGKSVMLSREAPSPPRSPSILGKEILISV